MPSGYFSLPESPLSTRLRVSIASCTGGEYCVNGLRHQCVGGTFSADVGRSSPCTTPCNAGYYCPSGTAVLSPALMCDTPTAYCPLGSTTPLNTSEGYFAVAVSSTSAVALYYNESVCPAGSYCVAGVATLCPPGRYGDVTGATDGQCTGPCLPGYYCPPGSTSATQAPCGSAAVFCPEVTLLLLLR